MNAPVMPLLDRRAVRAAFTRAASHYDAAAVLQREIADRLMTRLDYIRLEPARALDLGCGTGYVLHELARRYRRAHWFGLDLAFSMAQAAQARSTPPLPFGMGRALRRDRFINADAEALPFANESFDLVVSNLALQWCDPDMVFAECRRVLRPGGLLIFTTFGPDTLKELRAAWRAADSAVHVHDFPDMHDLGDALVRARFADPVMDIDHLTLTYAEVSGLLRDLKAIGAHNAATNRHAGLTGKRRYARFRQAYENFRGADDRLPASYEVVHGHAWAPDISGEGQETRGAGQGTRSEEWKPINIVRRT